MYFVKTLHSQIGKVDEIILYKLFLFLLFCANRIGPDIKFSCSGKKKLLKIGAKFIPRRSGVRSGKRVLFYSELLHLKKQAMNSLLQLLKCMFKSMFESRC